LGDLDRDWDCDFRRGIRLAKTTAGCAADGAVFDALGGTVTAEILKRIEVANNVFDYGNFELQ